MCHADDNTLGQLSERAAEGGESSLSSGTKGSTRRKCSCLSWKRSRRKYIQLSNLRKHSHSLHALDLAFLVRKTHAQEK